MMKKLISVVLLAAAIAAVWVVLKPDKQGSGTLTVFCAAGLKKPVEEIVLEDVVSFMDCRVLTPELSIRTGKFGEYIFYKTTEMEKPQFFNLKGCEDHATRNTNELVEWITKTHLKDCIQKKKRSSKDAAKDQVKEKKQKKS